MIQGLPLSEAHFTLEVHVFTYRPARNTIQTALRSGQAAAVRIYACIMALRDQSDQWVRGGGWMRMVGELLPNKRGS